jgi:hypothetical protein
MEKLKIFPRYQKDLPKDASCPQCNRPLEGIQHYTINQEGSVAIASRHLHARKEGESNIADCVYWRDASGRDRWGSIEEFEASKEYTLSK